jgi:hypothetical protein
MKILKAIILTGKLSFLHMQKQTILIEASTYQSWTRVGSTRGLGRVGSGPDFCNSGRSGRVKKYEYFYSHLSQIAKFCRD